MQATTPNILVDLRRHSKCPLAEPTERPEVGASLLGGLRGPFADRQLLANAREWWTAQRHFLKNGVRCLPDEARTVGALRTGRDSGSVTGSDFLMGGYWFRKVASK